MSYYEPSGEGPQTVALPAVVGVGPVVYRFPGAVLVKLHAVTFKLVAAGGGVARVPVVSLVDGVGATVAAIAAPFTLAGGDTSVYTFGPGVQQFGANNAANIGGPFVAGWLPCNLTLKIAVVNAVAGDVLSDMRLILDQCPVTVGERA